MNGVGSIDQQTVTEALSTATTTMNSIFSHRSLTRTAWQARPVAYAVGASADRVGQTGAGRGLERLETPVFSGLRPQGKCLFGCNARRPEDPGGWQEQKLS